MKNPDIRLVFVGVVSVYAFFIKVKDAWSHKIMGIVERALGDAGDSFLRFSLLNFGIGQYLRVNISQTKSLAFLLRLIMQVIGS